MHTTLHTFGISELYFELPEDPTAEDESHEESRYAELSEVLPCYIHINHVAYYDWEELRQGK
jgi:hypothetical protein